jgi:alpha-mannosidase
VLPHRGDWRAARLHEAADELLVPLERVRALGEEDATTPPTGSVLGVDGAEVSAVTREDGRLTVRVYNASPNATVARVAHDRGPARGDVVDLRGREMRAFDGMLALRPWEIATLRIVE